MPAERTSCSSPLRYNRACIRSRGVVVGHGYGRGGSGRAPAASSARAPPAPTGTPRLTLFGRRPGTVEEARLRVGCFRTRGCTGPTCPRHALTRGCAEFSLGPCRSFFRSASGTARAWAGGASAAQLISRALSPVMVKARNVALAGPRRSWRRAEAEACSFAEKWFRHRDLPFRAGTLRGAPGARRDRRTPRATTQPPPGASRAPSRAIAIQVFAPPPQRPGTAVTGLAALVGPVAGCAGIVRRRKPLREEAGCPRCCAPGIAGEACRTPAWCASRRRVKPSRRRVHRGNLIKACSRYSARWTSQY